MRNPCPSLRSALCPVLLVFAICQLNYASFALAEEKLEKPSIKWRSMFDGKSLDRWQVLSEEDFDEGGKVRADDGKLILEKGTRATGVRFRGKFPSSNYEITLEGMRVDGGDFFCGLSFPVGKGSLTLILGGWGGWVCGLSCIDDRYAINNDTACGVEFKNNRWYQIRLRVTGEAVQVSVDDKQIIDLETEGYKLAVSEEMKPCLPLGIATWKTTGAIRNIQYRRLPKQRAVDREPK